MKILVTVKRVIDYNVRVRVKADASDVDLTHVKMAMNPFCEIAVEEAIRLKEQGIASEVVVVSVGPEAAQEQIRSALALGADRGLLVQTDDFPSSLNVAKLLKAVVDQEKPQLILMGKQSIDTDNNQTGQMLAGLMHCSQATFASKLSIEENKARVTREVDGGLETLLVTLPAVVTADLRLNEPRYASLPNIMKAKRKPIDRVTPEALGVVMRSQLTQLKVESPAPRKAGVVVPSLDALLDKLTHEAKVIG